VLAVEVDADGSVEVDCFFAGTASTDDAGGAAGVGSDAIVIPNESIDMVHFLQVNTLDSAGADDIEGRTHFVITSLIERFIGGTGPEVDGL
jgi:hypothetical protein